MPEQPTGHAPRDPRLGNNPLATPALICAFIVPSLGLILGLVALGFEGGRSKAKAAVVISIIWGLTLLIGVATGYISW